MRRVAVEVRRHAVGRVPVLVQGESGTGKDLVARALHVLSRRAGAYVPLNVGALSEGVVDSELFGHRRGAFTGAVAHRLGAFELAHRGTLFLDEIAEIGPAVQVKLLRAVEEGEVRPVGAAKPTLVDTRIVSASWAHLPTRIAEGRFRADLYHRLSTVVIELPPLRHRKSDLPLLGAALLQRMSPEVGEKSLSSGALARLVTHSWPGNVRELASVLYRAATLSTRVVEAHHIGIAMPADGKGRRIGPADAPQLLKEHGGNVSAAARASGVARTTFRAWLERARRNQRLAG